MLKKRILLLTLILAAALAFGVNVLSQRAPGLLRAAIEKALNKKVVIRSIDYHFPGVFDLEGFEIQEKEPFPGEASFTVQHIRLDVSLLSLSKKRLIIDKLDVEDADITIRQYHHKLTHALSDAVTRVEPNAGAGEASADAKKTAQSKMMPLEIRQFSLKNSHFKFIDYDVDPNGFVTALDQINGDIKDIVLPFSGTKTSYRLSARLLQGREQRPAAIRMEGWTQASTFDTDANLSFEGVFLPYFRPYYSQVTPAAIEDGYLNSKANFHIEKNDLTLNVDAELVNVLFQSYEEGDQLFGLKADEILSFLKDRSGRLKFQIVVRWNIADRSVRAKDVIRKSIERSLKNTVIGNVGNILENTLQKLGEKGLDKNKEDVSGAIKKIKELLKY